MYKGKIAIELPIKSIIIDSLYYKLIIIDNRGIYYYFNGNDDYDGYSCDLIIPIEDNHN